MICRLNHCTLSWYGIRHSLDVNLLVLLRVQLAKPDLHWEKSQLIKGVLVSIDKLLGSCDLGSLQPEVGCSFPKNIRWVSTIGCHPPLLRPSIICTINSIIIVTPKSLTNRVLVFELNSSVKHSVLGPYQILHYQVLIQIIQFQVSRWIDFHPGIIPFYHLRGYIL